jgi:hypothetical protein
VARTSIAGQRMSVAVAERGHQKAAAEVDVVDSLRKFAGAFAHGTHDAVDHQQRVGHLAR